jgi:hypothetical protein
MFQDIANLSSDTNGDWRASIELSCFASTVAAVRRFAGYCKSTENSESFDSGWQH